MKKILYLELAIHAAEVKNKNSVIKKNRSISAQTGKNKQCEIQTII